MNYFEELNAKREALDQQGQDYLDTLPFIDNPTIIEKLEGHAERIWVESGKDWNNIPNWVVTTIDSHVPLSIIPKNGSLGFAIGHSVIAQEARLRNLLEVVEGRTDFILDIPIVAK